MCYGLFVLHISHLSAIAYAIWSFSLAKFSRSLNNRTQHIVMSTDIMKGFADSIIEQIPWSNLLNLVKQITKIRSYCRLVSRPLPPRPHQEHVMTSNYAIELMSSHVLECTIILWKGTEDFETLARFYLLTPGLHKGEIGWRLEGENFPKGDEDARVTLPPL